MKNNKGFSLMEIIVVVSILAILAAVVIGNFTNLSQLNLTKAAKTIDESLNKIKVLSLSDANGEATLKLSMVDDNVILNVNGGDDVRLGKYEVKVYYDDTSSFELEDTDITISFNNSGEFNDIQEKPNKYVKKIEIIKSANTRTVVCEKLTGKHYIE